MPFFSHFRLKAQITFIDDDSIAGSGPFGIHEFSVIFFFCIVSNNKKPTIVPSSFVCHHQSVIQGDFFSDESLRDDFYSSKVSCICWDDAHFCVSSSLSWLNDLVTLTVLFCLKDFSLFITASPWHFTCTTSIYHIDILFVNEHRIMK